MDHLQTDDERRTRWYATHLRPQYVPVVEEVENVAPTLSGKSSRKDELSTGKRRDGVVHGIPTSSLPSNSKALSYQLNTYGFAVVTGALTREECDEALRLAWDFVEYASFAERSIQTTTCNEKDDNAEEGSMDDFPVRRDDRRSHSSPYFPRSVEGGILPYYGSGHSTVCWYVRSRPVLSNIFASIWSVQSEELISSLDGMVLWRDGKEHRTDAGWFHIDQNPIHKPDFECVQGLVNLLPVTPKTGGNVLVSKSHRLFPTHYISKGEKKDGVNPDNGSDAFTSSESSARSNNDGCSDFYRTRLDEIDGDDWKESMPAACVSTFSKADNADVIISIVEEEVDPFQALVRQHRASQVVDSYECHPSDPRKKSDSLQQSDATHSQSLMF